MALLILSYILDFSIALIAKRYKIKHIDRSKTTQQNYATYKRRVKQK